MSDLIPIFMVDNRTVCAHLHAKCKKDGKTTTSQHDFVRRCQDNLPRTGTHSANTGSGLTQWEIVSQAGNFLVSGKPHFQVTNVAPGKSIERFAPGASDRGPKTLKSAVEHLANRHCNDFDDGKPIPFPALPQAGTVPAGSLLMSVVDLPGDGYPDAAISAAPAFAPHTATHGLTWIQVAHTLRAAQDKIAFGAAVVLGAIVLYTTRGSLPPIEAPMTPSLAPLLGTDGHRYPGA